MISNSSKNNIVLGLPDQYYVSESNTNTDTFASKVHADVLGTRVVLPRLFRRLEIYMTATF
jgi:hypothetical protein